MRILLSWFGLLYAVALVLFIFTLNIFMIQSASFMMNVLITLVAGIVFMIVVYVLSIGGK